MDRNPDTQDRVRTHGAQIPNGQSFFGPAMLDDGRIFRSAPSEPQHSGNGVVWFPEGWSNDDAREWRRENNVPGKEWPGPSSAGD